MILRAILILLVSAGFSPVWAQSGKDCAAMDRPCLLKSLEQTAASIGNAQERDEIYRKIARTLTLDGNPDKALAVIPLITGNEQKALILGDIGLAAAEAGFSANRQRAVFQKLLDEAKGIKQDKAQGVAYAEIAVALALSGNATSSNEAFSLVPKGAMKDKSLARAAAMRVGKNDAAGAIAYIAAIESQSYRNKAYDAVSNLFLEKAQITEAYACASRIDNAYLRAKAIQRILDRGNADKTGITDTQDTFLKALD